MAISLVQKTPQHQLYLTIYLLYSRNCHVRIAAWCRPRAESRNLGFAAVVAKHEKCTSARSHLLAQLWQSTRVSIAPSSAMPRKKETSVAGKTLVHRFVQVEASFSSVTFGWPCGAAAIFSIGRHGMVEQRYMKGWIKTTVLWGQLQPMRVRSHPFDDPE